MEEIIKKLGKYICEKAENNPQHVKNVLNLAFKLYELKLRYFPDKRLPKSRQYSATYIANIISEISANKSVSALVNIFMPCELLDTFGITPMCAELYSAYLTGAYAESVFSTIAQNAGVPETFCSYHKILLGCAYSKVFPKPSFAINSSFACDANNLTFSELAKFYNIPHFYIDVPSNQSQKDISYVAEQLKKLSEFLERQTKIKFDEKKLKKNLIRSQQTIQNLRLCLKEKSRHCLSNTMTSELYEIYLLHDALGTKEALKYSEMLCSEIQNSPSPQKPRVLWIHTTPFWQEVAQDIFNFNNKCEIVACDMNFENLIDIDPDKPWESMAKRLVLSNWNSGLKRIETAIKMAKELNVDGAICFCHWGCKQTNGISSLLKFELEKNGFPTLILNGDGCDRKNSSDGQISTRLNAFIELLEKKHG